MRSPARIDIVLFDRIHNRLSRYFKLADQHAYTAARVSQVDTFTPKFRRVRWSFGHDELFLRNVESVHETGSVPLCRLHTVELFHITKSYFRIAQNREGS